MICSRFDLDLAWKLPAVPWSRHKALIDMCSLHIHQLTLPMTLPIFIRLFCHENSSETVLPRQSFKTIILPKQFSLHILLLPFYVFVICRARCLASKHIQNIPNTCLQEQSERFESHSIYMCIHWHFSHILASEIEVMLSILNFEYGFRGVRYIQKGWKYN